MRGPVTVGIVALLAMAGCASKPLHDIRHQGNGPDEFSILPAKPLTAPQDYAFLPAPTPGGSNLTDRDPNAEAVEALGGRPSTATQVPGSDAALVTAASRNGVEPGVRESLAVEDAEFRKRQGRLVGFKLFPVDRYEQVYRKDKLNPFDQAEKFRRSGFETPTSPPVED